MMSKILALLLTISISFLVQAQNGSPRKVLVENFSYGTSYNYQKLFDTISQYSDEAILINYGPHFFLKEYDAATNGIRGKYWNEPDYSDHLCYIIINGVPTCSYSNPQSNRYITLSKYHIDSAYSILSPFEVTVEHSFNQTMDSMIINVDVLCTMDYTGRNLNLWLNPTQKILSFGENYGTTGRSFFYQQSWEVAPDTGAINLPESWTTGQRISINYKWPLRGVYDISQMSVVALIQDFTTLEVLQSAESPLVNPELPNVEISPSTIFDATNHCVDRYTPVVAFMNVGFDTIRSVQFSTFLNEVKSTEFWSGAVGPGEYGTHRFTNKFFQPNQNNKVAYRVELVNGKRTSSPATEMTSEKTILRLSSLAVIDTAFIDFSQLGRYLFGFSDLFRWEVNYGVANSGNAVALFDPNSSHYNWSVPLSMYLHPISLFGRDSSANLEFKYIASPRIYIDRNGSRVINSDSTKTDTFALQATTDCGLNWTTLWQKSGRDLMTTSFSDTSELAERHWRTVKASLAPVVGRIAHFRFVNLSHGMAQVYLDDIRIRPVPVVPPHTYTPSPYPNPTNGLLHLDLEFAGAGNSVQTSMFDALGRQVIGQVRHTLPAGLTTLSVDMSVLGNGYYYLVVNMPDGSKKSWPVSVMR